VKYGDAAISCQGLIVDSYITSTMIWTAVKIISDPKLPSREQGGCLIEKGLVAPGEAIQPQLF
jgi:hypothetical protein